MSIKSTTDAKALNDIETVEEAFRPDLMEAIDAGIKAISTAHGVNVQKDRYKSMRAIAFQAFSEYFEQGTFEELVERASSNVDNLPDGWMLTMEAERARKAARAGVKKPAAPKAKAPAKTAKRNAETEG